MNDFGTFSMIYKYFRWFCMILNDFQRILMILYYFQWFLMMFVDFHWFSIIFNDFKWNWMIFYDFPSLWIILNSFTSFWIIFDNFQSTTCGERAVNVQWTCGERAVNVLWTCGEPLLWPRWRPKLHFGPKHIPKSKLDANNQENDPILSNCQMINPKFIKMIQRCINISIRSKFDIGLADFVRFLLSINQYLYKSMKMIETDLSQHENEWKRFKPYKSISKNHKLDRT